MSEGATSGGPAGAVVVPFRALADGAGAARVVEDCVRALRDRCAAVDMIVVDPTLLPRARRDAAHARSLASIVPGTGAERWHVVSRIEAAAWPRAAWRLAPALVRSRWSVRDDVALARLPRLTDVPGGTYDVVISNYLSCTEVSAVLVGPERRITVLHDMTAADVADRDVRQALGRSGRLVALTAEDAHMIARAVPGHGCDWGLPSTGTSAAAGVPAGGDGGTTDAGRIDLLFVGGAQPANVRSLHAFVSQCFVPSLRPRGVTLAVAGDAGAAAWPRGAPDGVARLGRVADLAPVYAAATLVICPIVEGSGVSVKAIEAVHFGKPVAGTPLGLRGLSCASAFGRPPPFDAGWADWVWCLLTRPDLRLTLRDGLRSGLAQPRLNDVLARLISEVLHNRAGPPAPSTST